jgi:hypothetical protein
MRCQRTGAGFIVEFHFVPCFLRSLIIRATHEKQLGIVISNYSKHCTLTRMALS